MITWTLKDLNEANAILTLIAKLPYEVAQPVIDRLRAEMASQLPAPPPERKRITPA